VSLFETDGRGMSCRACCIDAHELQAIIPGDQEGVFELARQLRKFLYSAIGNTATGNVLLVYLTKW
jgi:hypothetical protein